MKKKQMKIPKSNYKSKIEQLSKKYYKNKDDEDLDNKKYSSSSI